MKAEKRFAVAGVSQRAKDGEAPVIEGHGALFDTETVIAGLFRERIAKGAFADSLRDQDVVVAYNHEASMLLGRVSAGTARVYEDDKGLRYEATPPATRADVVESVKRGDVTGSSFQFTVENDADEEWDFAESKKGMLPLRTIKRARLYEVGPVVFPAYETTTVSARAEGKLAEARAALAAAETREAEAAQTEQRAKAAAAMALTKLKGRQCELKLRMRAA